MLEHFSVNCLSQFMLTLNLLALLEASAHGGRVVFNTTQIGELRWDDVRLVDVGKNPASQAAEDWQSLWNVSLELCGDEETRRCAARLTSMA